MINLKPCPFCGGNDIVYEEALSVTYCNDCGGELDEGFGSDWNTRPIEDALQAENERLKEELQCEKTRSQLNLEAEERRMLNITHYCAEIDRLTARIAELEAEIERLTAHSDIERQDDKWIPEVQQ